MYFFNSNFYFSWILVGISMGLKFFLAPRVLISSNFVGSPGTGYLVFFQRNHQILNRKKKSMSVLG